MNLPASSTHGKERRSRRQLRSARHSPAGHPGGGNIHKGERIASVVLGGILLVTGLRDPSVKGMAVTLAGSWLLHRGASGHSHLYDALDLSTSSDNARALELQQSITIGKTAEELYQAWREPQVLSQAMAHFAHVQANDGSTIRWQLHTSIGQGFTWETQIMEEQPYEYLSWTSINNATWMHEGSISFCDAPGDRGTEVTLRLRFLPPGGVIGTAAMKLMQVVPSIVASKALRRFKSFVETGEVPTLEHNPAAYKGFHRK